MTDAASLLESLAERLEGGENLEIEFKAARAAIPKDVWPTLSAFANTQGGWVILGASESDARAVISGVVDAPNLLKTLNDALRNAQKISYPVCGAMDASIQVLDERQLIVIRVPAAPRTARPVYINGNVYEGTYVRRHSADYRCRKPEVDRMMREASDVSSDATILPHLGLDDLDRNALARFRQRCQTRNPADPKHGYDDERFLQAVGGYRRDRETGERGITVAGLLLAGTDESIRDWRSRHLIDFRVVTSEASVDDRWDDRIVWEGNLLGAFEAIYPKLVADVAVPFRLSRGVRTDESPTHVALREALINLLVHADYAETFASLIKRTPEGYLFRNPGDSRVPQTELLTGDRSDPRNPTLVRMFRFAGLAEEAGTGMPKIMRAWRELGFSLPNIDPGTERYEFTLNLRHAHLLSDDDRAWLGILGEQWSESEQLAMVMARHEGEVDNHSLRRMTGQHPADASKVLTQLRGRALLERVQQAGWPPRYQLGQAALSALPVEERAPVPDLDGSVMSPAPIELPTASSGRSVDAHSRNIGGSGPSLVGSGPSLGGSEASLVGSDPSLMGSDPSLMGSEANLSGLGEEHQPSADSSGSLHAQLSKLAQPAREQPHLDADLRDALIEELCALAPLSVRELAELLGRSTQHLRFVIRPLVTLGRLVLQYPGQPSHPGQRYIASRADGDEPVQRS
ncbi:MAG: RNA-binding domain-containing protein [Gemmatimonadaceae bacterium]